MIEILKVITGSRAYGLATEKSDTDYRGVFVISTRDILKLTKTRQTVSKLNGKEDDVAHELEKFLFLAIKSNPSILDVFASPVVMRTLEGNELRKLFPYVWSSKYVKDAFLGYSRSQRRFIDDYLYTERALKAAVARIRVLYQGTELLKTGELIINLKGSPIYGFCKRMRQKMINWKNFSIIENTWETNLLEAYEKNSDKVVDIDKVNNFLLDIRKRYW